MSKRWVSSTKPMAVLGVMWLALGTGPRWAKAAASVPPPFSNANYANRYVCNVTADDNEFTAVMKINPNGKGGYSTGTFVGSISSVPGGDFDPAALPPNNFCSYTLAPVGSGYGIDSQGDGTEVLSWTLNAGQNAACPASFVMNTAIELRTTVNANNIVARTVITSGNLLGLSPFDPGYGYCFK